MKSKQTILACALTLGGITAMTAVFSGCQGTETTVQPGDSAAAVTEDTGLSGAQLWAQTCAHCHNSRSPASYSDAKWEVAMAHMRQQAYLSGDQARKVLDFLKASN